MMNKFISELLPLLICTCNNKRIGRNLISIFNCIYTLYQGNYTTTDTYYTHKTH